MNKYIDFWKYHMRAVCESWNSWTGSYFETLHIYINCQIIDKLNKYIEFGKYHMRAIRKSWNSWTGSEFETLHKNINCQIIDKLNKYIEFQNIIWGQFERVEIVEREAI